MRVRAHVFIAGRVQGVFFRAETQARASRVGMSGWVRNLRDGRVEALFEGDEDAVREMVDFCKAGPPGAQVVDAVVRWELYTGEFRDFKVL